MAVEARAESLRTRHAILDQQILAETSRPYFDSTAVKKMKMEKLRVKEELERLSRN